MTTPSVTLPRNLRCFGHAPLASAACAPAGIRSLGSRGVPARRRPPGAPPAFSAELQCSSPGLKAGVEAAIGTLIPHDGKLLVLINGAYGRRIRTICERIGRTVTTLETDETSPHPLQRYEAQVEGKPDMAGADSTG